VGFLLSWIIFWQIDPTLNRAGATALYNLVSGNTSIAVIGWIAALGDSVWFPVVFYLYVLRRDSYDWTSATVLAVAIVTATALVTVLKIVFGLPRPFQDPTLALDARFETPTDHGLPSGHTTAAFTVATVVWTRYPRWRIPFVTLAIATGVCMIILGLHFPSDVLAGTFLGIFSGTFALSLAKLRTQT
jgi:undecaprenyl-diphosphatase